MGAIREDAGKYPEALQAYNDFIKKYPTHFLAPRMHEAIGRVQEISGAAAQARDTYDQIVKMYPMTAWAQHAQERLAAIADVTVQPQQKKK
jgi:TolA-binding protein